MPQPRHRVTSKRGFSHAYIPAHHPIHEYKTRVELATAKQIARPMPGPIEIEIEFAFQRPKSHWNKSGIKDSAPEYPHKKDWDNLAKGVCDAAQGIAFIDDDQIVAAKVKRSYLKDRNEQGFTKLVIKKNGESESRPLR